MMKSNSKVADVRLIDYAPRRAVPEAILKALDSDGVMPARMKTSAMKVNIAGIFSNPVSAERELYGILLRSVRDAKKSELHVEIDDKNRTLAIYDVNGSGIPWAKFYTKLRVIGHGENLIAYTGLTEKLRFETYAEDTGDSYCFSCRNGNAPVRIDAPKMKSYGTRMSMVLRKGINKGRLAAGLVNCARFSGVPTYLHCVETGIIVPDDRGNLEANGMYDQASMRKKFPAGRTLLDSTSVSMRIRSHTSPRNLAPVVFTTKKYEIAGHYWVDPNLADDEGRRETYLNGLPIQNTMRVPLYDWCMSIRDDADKIATTDRDRLTDGAEEELAAEINAKLTRHFARLNISNIRQWRRSKFAKMYTATYTQLRHRKLNDESYQLVHFLEQEIYVIGGKDWRTKLHMHARTGPLICMDGLDAAQYKPMQKKFGKKALFFKFADENAFTSLEPEDAKRYDLLYGRDILDGKHE